MQVREIITSDGWWLCSDNNFACRVASTAEQVTDYTAVPTSGLPLYDGSVEYYPALVVGYDPNDLSELVIGYVAMIYSGGTFVYKVPVTGKPVEYVVLVNSRYNKRLGRIDRENQRIEDLGRAYGLVITLSDGSKVTVPFNIVCGGLCIAAVISIVAASGAAAVKFWSDAKIAEAEAVKSVYDAEKKRWDLIQKYCESNPDNCYQNFGAIVASASQSVVAKAIEDVRDDGLDGIIAVIKKWLVPPLVSILSLVMMFEVIKSLFRR